IENTRLLNELRESLQQQTATSDVLQVISGSPGELDPVFQAVLENATRLCDAKFGTLNLHHGETFRNVALYNVPSAYLETRSPIIRPRGLGGGFRSAQPTLQVMGRAHSRAREMRSIFGAHQPLDDRRQILVEPGLEHGAHRFADQLLDRAAAARLRRLGKRVECRVERGRGRRREEAVAPRALSCREDLLI